MLFRSQSAVQNIAPKARRRSRWRKPYPCSELRLALLIRFVLKAEPVVAELVKFEIVRTISPVFEGRSFGPTGTHDGILARVIIAVSPTDYHNAAIADTERAPSHTQGLVEATADSGILRPANAARGNRMLFYAVVN